MTSSGHLVALIVRIDTIFICLSGINPHAKSESRLHPSMYSMRRPYKVVPSGNVNCQMRVSKQHLPREDAAYYLVSTIKPRNRRSLCQTKFIVSECFIESICLSDYDSIKPPRKKFIIELLIDFGTLQWLESIIEQFQTERWKWHGKVVNLGDLATINGVDPAFRAFPYNTLDLERKGLARLEGWCAAVSNGISEASRG